MTQQDVAAAVAELVESMDNVHGHFVAAHPNRDRMISLSRDEATAILTNFAAALQQRSGAVERCATHGTPLQPVCIECAFLHPVGAVERERVIAAMSIELEKHPTFTGDATSSLVWSTRLYDAILGGQSCP